LIDRTGSPVLEGLQEHRIAIAARLERINALEEELDQYPATESDSEEESYRKGDVYFDLNEQERQRFREQIVHL
jgi:hypothetical protein